MSNDDDDFDEDSADCVDTSFVYQLHKSFKVFMKKFIFNKFKKNVFNLNQNFFLRVFYIFYSKIVDFDEVSQFFNSELRMSKIFDRLYSFIKHNINRIKQYNLFSSYIFNYGKFPIKKYYTTDIFYVDKSSFVFKLNQSKKNTKTRFFNFFFKKRVYVLFSKLRTFKLLKYKCLPQLRIKKSIVSGKSRK